MSIIVTQMSFQFAFFLSRFFILIFIHWCRLVFSSFSRFFLSCLKNRNALHTNWQRPCFRVEPFFWGARDQSKIHFFCRDDFDCFGNFTKMATLAAAAGRVAIFLITSELFLIKYMQHFKFFALNSNRFQNYVWRQKIGKKCTRNEKETSCFLSILWPCDNFLKFLTEFLRVFNKKWLINRLKAHHRMKVHRNILWLLNKANDENGRKDEL